MVEAGVAAELVERSAGPRFRIGRPEDEPTGPGGDQSAGAHGAGLEGHHQCHIGESPRAQGGGGVAQGQDLGMGGGVPASSRSLWREATPAPGQDDRPHGDVVMDQGGLRLDQGQSHGLGVVHDRVAHRATVGQTEGSTPPADGRS